MARGQVRHVCERNPPVYVALFVAALVLGGCAAKHTAAPVEHLPESLAIYGRLPSIEGVALSPDGTRLAYVQTTPDNARTVGVVSLSDHSLVGSVRAGDAKLRGIEWVDDDRVLLLIGATTIPLGLIGWSLDEWGMLQIYDVREHRAQPLLGLEEKTLNTVVGHTMIRRAGDRTLLYVVGYYLRADQLLPGLFQIDAGNGAEQLILKGKPDVRKWLVDAHGEVIAEQQYRSDDQRSVFSIRRDGMLREAATLDDPFGQARMVGFGPSADSLTVDVQEGNQTVWKPLSLSDGTWGTTTEKGIDDALLDRDDRVIGWMREGDEPRYGFDDPEVQVRWDQVVRSFEGERVRLESHSDDWSKVVVLVEGERDGYAYELVDTKTHTAERVGAVYDGLSKMFDIMRITYPAADGLEITAYLTLPDTRPLKNLPLIVFPHGGPGDRDLLQFDWWAQALAAGGYAVLQPNYRGSTGSAKLFESGFGEWGRKMQTDLSDGVRFLARKGIVDPSRVCIVGASYGGYAALAGVTLDPGVYRCAVSVSGVSDLPRFRRWTQGPSGRGGKAEDRWWDRYWGATNPDDPILVAISPSRHAASVTVPVLLIHGRDDTTVPFEQSEIMADAMQRAGKPVELVTLSGEDHHLSRGATRLQTLEYTLGFLRVHNPAP
jgi:dipeptidyl aminopeptidase/acylaminoacyl peptidase